MLKIYQQISSAQKLYLAVIFSILGSFFVIAISASAKYMSSEFDTLEIVFQRSLICLILLITIFILFGRLDLIKTKKPWLHISRSLTGFISISIIFKAYSLLPMAETSSILFLSPMIATILSILFLKEKVGMKRIIAISIGFIGVITIVSPSTENLLLEGVIYALLGSFTIALVKVQVRNMGKTESSLTTIFYFMIICTVISGIYSFAFSDITSNFNNISTDIYYAIAICGVTTILSQIFRTEALKLGKVSIVTPIEYSSIIWATLAGWMIWNDIPPITTFIGTLLIIGANIYIIYRERKLKK